MARHGGKAKDILKLTPEEAESMGLDLEAEGTPRASDEVRALPLHEQVVGALTVDDVVEALTGEVTPEGREDVDEEVADQQEDAAERASAAG